MFYSYGRSEMGSDDYYELKAHYGKTVQIGISFNNLNDRLHISPHSSITFYDSKHITDTPDQYLNDLRFGLYVSYDVLRYKQFSLFVQPGIDFSFIKGLTGTGGWVAHTKSEYADFSGYFLSFAPGINYRLKKLPLKFSVVPYEWQRGKLETYRYRGQSGYFSIAVYI